MTSMISASEHPRSIYAREHQIHEVKEHTTCLARSVFGYPLQPYPDINSAAKNPDIRTRLAGAVRSPFVRGGPVAGTPSSPENNPRRTLGTARPQPPPPDLLNRVCTRTVWVDGVRVVGSHCAGPAGPACSYRVRPWPVPG